MSENKNSFPDMKLKPIEEISSEKMAEIIARRNRTLELLGYNVSDSSAISNDKIFSIRYIEVREIGVVKLDINARKAYRLDKETEVWREDSELFDKYLSDELDWTETDINDVFPYGPPFSHGRFL